jgi:uncharacterized membrane protein YdjX (TVP38/TMEM64 family)
MKNKILKTILIVLIIAALAVSVYFILRSLGFTDKEKFIELRTRLGESFLFWFIIGCLQIIQVIFIPVSNQIITAPIAVIFPINELWKVWLTSWISIWIATLILYFIGRWGGQKLLNWVLSDKKQTEKCANFLNKGWMFYPLGMLLPLPDDIVTVLAGTGKMKFWYVFICSLLTRALDTSISVFGFGILAKNWWGWLIMIGGFILLTIGSIWLFKYQKKKEMLKKAQSCPDYIEKEI